MYVRMYVCVWSHLLHPDGEQLVSIVGKEGSHVGQERCCEQTVSYQVSHVFLKTLKQVSRYKCVRVYIHKGQGFQACVGEGLLFCTCAWLTATVCSQRTLSPASPVTSLSARSSFTSISSDFFLKLSFMASFSPCCFFSWSSFSPTCSALHYIIILILSYVHWSYYTTCV